MSPGFGTSTIMYAIPNVSSGNTISAIAATIEPRRTHFQLICSRRLRPGPVGPPPDGPPPPGARGGGGGGCWGGP
jgi:hypothetical protein